MSGRGAVCLASQFTNGMKRPFARASLLAPRRPVAQIGSQGRDSFAENGCGRGSAIVCCDVDRTACESGERVIKRARPP